MRIDGFFGPKLDILEKKYGAAFVISVDSGAWHKLNEDFSGSRFNQNSYYSDSRGDLQAKATEYYFVPTMSKFGVPVMPKDVNWEMWDHTVIGRKIDIKSKRRNTNPVQCYGYHVDESQILHTVDHYVFTDVFYKSKDAEIPLYIGYSGWLPKEEFLEKAIFVCKGDKQPDGFDARMDCRWLDENTLRPMRSFVGSVLKLINQ
jgi:hypothetical protein